MAAEVVGGLYTKSLALLADAAHMLADAGGLALALFAIWFAEKPATPSEPTATTAPRSWRRWQTRWSSSASLA